MANFVDLTRKLVIVMADGQDSAGNDVSVQRTFANLSETADADKVLQAGQALASLMSGTVTNIYIKDTNEVLENEAE